MGRQYLHYSNLQWKYGNSCKGSKTHSRCSSSSARNQTRQQKSAIQTSTPNPSTIQITQRPDAMANLLHLLRTESGHDDIDPVIASRVFGLSRRYLDERPIDIYNRIINNNLDQPTSNIQQQLSLSTSINEQFDSGQIDNAMSMVHMVDSINNTLDLEQADRTFVSGSSQQQQTNPPDNGTNRSSSTNDLMQIILDHPTDGLSACLLDPGTTIDDIKSQINIPNHLFDIFNGSNNLTNGTLVSNGVCNDDVLHIMCEVSGGGEKKRSSKRKTEGASKKISTPKKRSKGSTRTLVQLKDEYDNRFISAKRAYVKVLYSEVGKVDDCLWTPILSNIINGDNEDNEDNNDLLRYIMGIRDLPSEYCTFPNARVAAKFAMVMEFLQQWTNWPQTLNPEIRTFMECHVIEPVELAWDIVQHHNTGASISGREFKDNRITKKVIYELFDLPNSCGQKLWSYLNKKRYNPPFTNFGELYYKLTEMAEAKAKKSAEEKKVAVADEAEEIEGTHILLCLISFICVLFFLILFLICYYLYYYSRWGCTDSSC